MLKKIQQFKIVGENGDASLLIFRPQGEQIQKALDFLYHFGKQVYHGGRSHGWNGNNFVIQPKEDFIVEDVNGSTISLVELSSLIHREEFHCKDEYWNVWVKRIVRDKTIAKIIVDDIEVEIWYVNPKVHGNQHEFELRINSESARMLEKKFEPFYKEELTQYHEVPLDLELLAEQNRGDHSVKKMWVVGVDYVVYQYYSSSKSQYYGGTCYGGLRIKDKQSCGWYAKSLSDAVDGVSTHRKIDFRKHLAEYDNGVAKADMIKNMISTANSLKERGFAKESEEIKTFLEKYL